MLELKYVRQNIDAVKRVLIDRNDSTDLDKFEKSEAKRREILVEIEALRNSRNVVSDEIAKMKRQGENADTLVSDMRTVSAKIKEIEKTLSENEEIVKNTLISIPNIPHPSVPVGNDESDNSLVRQVGNIPDFNFKPLAHWTLGENLKILDFEKASKITGARFPLYMGAGARIERGLINFMLDLHTGEHGYTEVLPPFIVNRNSMTNTGQLPKFEEDLFKLDGWDYYLIPTAEVPVTNILQKETLDESTLPVKYTACTPCFRSEAGSYGKDTRGLIRQHQFNKVELVKFAHPDKSYDELETLLNNAEEVLKRLELPYRVVLLCTGDLGFSAAKTYDIEVWMPAQGMYREISSCSNFESFQARRGNIRFKSKGKKGTELVHTLNGSGLGVGRTVAAILENYQNDDGTVTVPEAIRPYLKGREVLSP